MTDAGFEKVVMIDIGHEGAYWIPGQTPFFVVRAIWTSTEYL